MIASGGSVSVIIPTAGALAPGKSNGRAMVLDLIESLGNEEGIHTIIVVDDHAPSSVHDELVSCAKTIVRPYTEPFNFSKKCNLGALTSSSDILFFLNDDMICLDPNWPMAIRQTLSRGDVGAVGGLLLTPEGLVQCAGHKNSPAPHIFGAGLDPTDPANRPLVGTERQVGGLSGACFAVRRDLFLEVGGMCELLPESYNDVDLGFKILGTGKSLIFNPAIRFTHFESATRDPKVKPEDFEFISRRWGRHFRHDPYTP